jgi:SAM-dependent methyltransferase
MRRMDVLRRARKAVSDPSRAARVARERARDAIDRTLPRLPFLLAKERVYNGSFYDEADAVQNPMYDRLADALYELLQPRSAVDVGCGTGRILSKLSDRGVLVRGVEGSRHAISRSPVADVIVRRNLERGVPNLGRFDLCICVEVAEHLPPRAAKTLVGGLTSLSDRVLFTAAIPGQGGVHHVNEQPQLYWIELFRRKGFEPSPLAAALVRELTEIDEPRWLRENLLVFERTRDPSLSRLA